ncbi:MAG: putative SAM-dependent methyltransferase [Phycisphaerales bacterium]|nr:putative SAM-dependent methyltransferase [Phycisphaerales bacterium]
MNIFVRALRSAVRRWRAGIRFRAYRREFSTYAAMSRRSGERLAVRWEDHFPQLGDRTVKTAFDPHYTYHPAWAARVLAAERPAKHVDISSSLQFVAMVSAFVPVDFYDYRPADLRLSQLSTASADLTRLAFPSDSVRSLSCMHTIEHVGLGRYGDPLDPDGDLKAARELTRVLAPGGLLIFVTPVGRPRVCFNAHRVYAHKQVLEMFAVLQVERFSLLPDDISGGLIDDAPEALVDAQEYGCGCFAFRKPMSLAPRA